MSLVSHIKSIISDKLIDPCFFSLLDKSVISIYKKPRYYRVDDESRANQIPKSNDFPETLEMSFNGDLPLNPVTFVLGLHPKELDAALDGKSWSGKHRGWKTEKLQEALRNLTGYEGSGKRHELIKLYYENMNALRVESLVNSPSHDELLYENYYFPTAKNNELMYVRDPWGNVQIISTSHARNREISASVMTHYRVLPRKLTYKWCSPTNFYEVTTLERMGKEVDTSFYLFALSVFNREISLNDPVKARDTVENIFNRISEEKGLSILSTDMSLYPPMPLHFRTNLELRYDLEKITDESYIRVYSPRVKRDYDKILKQHLTLSQENLIKVLGADMDSEFHLVVVFEPFLPVTKKMLLELSLHNRLNICKNLAETVMYLHDKCIIHDRITPDKLVFSQGKYKLLYHDFRSTIVMNNVDLDLLPYRSREAYRNDTKFFTSDIYALGYLFWYILNARDPYSSDVAQMSIIYDQLYHRLPAFDTEIESDVIELIKQMTYVDASERPSISQVYNELKQILSDM